MNKFVYLHCVAVVFFFPINGSWVQDYRINKFVFHHHDGTFYMFHFAFGQESASQLFHCYIPGTRKYCMPVRAIDVFIKFYSEYTDLDGFGVFTVIETVLYISVERRGSSLSTFLLLHFSCTDFSASRSSRRLRFHC